MAAVHVRSWQETYRGQVPDETLDAADAVPARERFWRGALTDPRWAANRIAVGRVDDETVGIAMAAPDADVPGRWWLHVLYVLAAHHGTGIAHELLAAVLPEGLPAVLRVADPNPRAQAFYRRSGFVPNGAVRETDGVREIEMERPPIAGRSTSVSLRVGAQAHARGVQ
ncbi:N-acetyltransferase [Microbacterium sp. SORGH_AS_0888]|uniref:GNAT family N-acetyltransferase n=1 Tax=Microbacterium sp. SORGH_AS_0888 TaxID=3041791 RepID=UPI0027D88EFB|nr:GNAT family N-acetyltransferase [Microbacterium sp. SORGH_AS_0888]